jgi:hypothetical protein
MAGEKPRENNRIFSGEKLCKLEQSCWFSGSDFENFVHVGVCKCDQTYKARDAIVLIDVFQPGPGPE